MTTGTDQAILYGARYKYTVLAWILLHVSLLAALVDFVGTTRPCFSLALPLWVLHAAVLTLVPTHIWIPGYDTPFSLFAECKGLAQGVTALILLRWVEARRPQRMGAVVVLYAASFAWSYRDTAHLNLLEDEVSRMVRTLPPKSRELSVHCHAARFNYECHPLECVCIGHCASYGNYELPTTQFRLRAHPGNGAVSARRVDTDAMEFDRDKVKLEDEPIYLDDVGQLGVSISRLRAGERTLHLCLAADARLAYSRVERR